MPGPGLRHRAVLGALRPRAPRTLRVLGSAGNRWRLASLAVTVVYSLVGWVVWSALGADTVARWWVAVGAVNGLVGPLRVQVAVRTHNRPLTPGETLVGFRRHLAGTALAGVFAGAVTIPGGVPPVAAVVAGAVGGAAIGAEAVLWPVLARHHPRAAALAALTWLAPLLAVAGASAAGWSTTTTLLAVAAAWVLAPVCHATVGRRMCGRWGSGDPVGAVEVPWRSALVHLGFIAPVWGAEVAVGTNPGLFPRWGLLVAVASSLSALGSVAVTAWAAPANWALLTGGAVGAVFIRLVGAVLAGLGGLCGVLAVGAVGGGWDTDPVTVLCAAAVGTIPVVGGVRVQWALARGVEPVPLVVTGAVATGAYMAVRDHRRWSPRCGTPGRWSRLSPSPWWWPPSPRPPV